MIVTSSLRFRVGASPRVVAGISLIEMLIALLVLSFGLLGMAGLQAYSLRNNTNAYYRSQATVLAYDMTDRLRANRLAAVGTEPGQRRTGYTSLYNVAIGGTPAGAGIPLQDLTEWKFALARALPSGDGAVACNGATARCRVTVQWDDSRGAAAPLQFVHDAEL